MLRISLVATGLVVSGLAFACPGQASGSIDAAGAAAQSDEDRGAKDPTACAKKADLVGANCSYTTGMMAQRVVAEGEPWSFTGRLVRSENALASHVAAPFTVGPDGQVNVIATEVLEALTTAELHQQPLSLDGKRLEVDGVTYFVLTSYQVPRS